MIWNQLSYILLLPLNEQYDHVINISTVNIHQLNIEQTTKHINLKSLTRMIYVYYFFSLCILSHLNSFWCKLIKGTYETLILFKLSDEFADPLIKQQFCNKHYLKSLVISTWSKNYTTYLVQCYIDCKCNIWYKKITQTTSIHIQI